MTFKERELKLDIEEKRWAREKEIIVRESAIKEERRTLKHKGIGMSKTLILFLFISCSIIEVFTGWVTVKSFSLAYDIGIAPDFSPLIALIGAVVSEVVGYAAYTLKAKAENTVGGLIYEQTMRGQ